MNEDEKKRFDAKTVVASEAIPDSDLSPSQKLQLIQAMTSNTILADIARQLTIANEIVTKRHQVEYASAQQKNPDIIYEVDPPIDLNKPTPADALVEAVTAENLYGMKGLIVLKRASEVIKKAHPDWNLGDELAWLKDKIQAALDAHEKAVNDGT